MLSAVETAIDLTRAEISAAEIRSILELGRGMLAHPVELLDGAADTVAALAKTHTLILITKGDLRDQQRKLAKSGLAPHFAHIEIVAEKNAAIYDGILRRHGIAPAEFLMVGNSLKSDILPVLALGGFAAHIPYHLLWAEDHTPEAPAAPVRFFELRTLRELPALLASPSS
jgi:putative hydrolase of the HAD superfamily